MQYAWEGVVFQRAWVKSLRIHGCHLFTCIYTDIDFDRSLVEEAFKYISDC